MRKLEWRNLLELIGAISIVSSLIFVGIEIRQAQGSIENERTVARIELGNDLRSEINDHLDVWVRGNAGAELTGLELELYKNLLNSRWNIADAIGITAISLGEEIIDNPGIIGFSGFLHNNPGARKIWTQQTTDFTARRELISGNSSPASRTVTTVLRHLEILDAAGQE